MSITVILNVPEGLPEIKAILTCKPKNQAELDAIVDAIGGPSAFTYFSSDSAHTKLADGTSLLVEAYDRVSYDRPIAPSIAKLKAAS